MRSLERIHTRMHVLGMEHPLMAFMVGTDIYFSAGSRDANWLGIKNW